MTAPSDGGAGDRLITAGEAAPILNVSKAWVYEQTRVSGCRTFGSGATSATGAAP
jgi:hypothetical protein